MDGQVKTDTFAAAIGEVIVGHGSQVSFIAADTGHRVGDFVAGSRELAAGIEVNAGNKAFDFGIIDDQFHIGAGFDAYFGSFGPDNLHAFQHYSLYVGRHIDADIAGSGRDDGRIDSAALNGQGLVVLPLF